MRGFLLDTNVVSELLRPLPDPRVRAWIASKDESLLYLSVLTLGEIRKGALLMPMGARSAALEAWLDDDLAARFARRILAVDRNVADTWGKLAAVAEKGALPVIDGLLAATALQHDLTLATRNVKDVAATGVPILNPWMI